MTETEWSGAPPTCGCTCGRAKCASRRLAHGTPSRYSHGCRCDVCCQAANERTGRRIKALNDASQMQAARAGLEWTSAELEVATRTDLTAGEVASLLGRSLLAVKLARFRCRTDPRYIALLGAPSRDGAT